MANVQKFLSNDGPHGLIVESVSRLKSESLIRGAVRAWIGDNMRHMFLLVVDMNQLGANDHVNFVRMIVEQSLGETKGKAFVLLLHYSPSRNIKTQCYPALFLGGWQHFFLDSVGDHGSESCAERLVQLACERPTMTLNDDTETVVQCLRESIRGLVPRILPYLVSQAIFYKEQSLGSYDSFLDRKVQIESLLNRCIGNTTLIDILCEKFASIWQRNMLSGIIRNATQAILMGTTQLSLTMSIHSSLVQSLKVFLTSSLLESNQWMNLEVVVHSTNKSTRDLFGMCMRDLPSIPVAELVLQGTRNSLTCLRSLPLSLVDKKRRPRFPFFYFISSFFDELYEEVVAVFARSGDERKVTSAEYLKSAIGMLETSTVDKCMAASIAQQRKVLALKIINFVSATPDSTLFDQYTKQFMEWKIGIIAEKFILGWFCEQLKAMNKCRNILAAHIVGTRSQSVLSRLHSIAMIKRSTGKSFCLSAQPGNDDIYEVLLETTEQALSELSPTEQTPVLFQVTSAVLSGREMHNHDPVRLRRLQLLQLSLELNLLGKVHDSYMIKNGVLAKDSLTISSFVKSLDLEPTATQQVRESMLYNCLAPFWRHIWGDLFTSDHSYLIDLILTGNVSNHHNSVSLLRCACAGGDDLVWGVPRNTLLLLNAKLSCSNLCVFRKDGKRKCVPHFLPSWLASKGDNSERQTTSKVFFSDYHHCYDCPLSESVFELVLSLLAREAEESDSKDLFLLLRKDLESETLLSVNDHNRLARLRAVGETQSLRGSAVAAISLSARTICFVAKVASEIASGTDCTVLSSTYSQLAVDFVNELMAQTQASWQAFFMAILMRARGEGSLMEALQPNGCLRTFSFWKSWIDGAPISGSQSTEALRLAERLLAEAEAEERRKASELRHCPHCNQTFIIWAENCGQFICGRDAHGFQGRHIYGCGRDFLARDAPRYVADERILAPMRRQVTEERDKLDRHRAASTLWDTARALHIPVVIVDTEPKIHRSSILPRVDYFLDSTDGCSDLVRLLWDTSNRAPRFDMLPDLIEVSFTPGSRKLAIICSHGRFYFRVALHMDPRHIPVPRDKRRGQ